MTDLRFEAYQPGDEVAISSLVWEVFSEYVGPGYAEEGIETFRQFIQPEELRKSAASGCFNMICCWSGSELAGVIAMRDSNHVSLLFVRREFHRKGIAHELFRLAKGECLGNHPEISEFSVNSSPYAVNIYERLGFEATGPEETQNGITYVPMKMTSQKS
ncbi:MAG: GNAT family N-acetyltransferase [Clostridia bacterium]|nr:GNAT family N-acetyltransferase [Clostridia bacterium]